MSNPSDAVAPAPEPDAECPRCRKPLPLCICDTVTPLENRIELLILQHPQEQDRALGTAQLTAAHLARSTVRVGLSWPSLAKALGKPVADPARWAVLYLGSVRPTDLGSDSDVVALTRKGEIAENQRAILSGIEGVVLLDGTWSQAKALWWRNPWMLKCRRVVLNPAHRSRYGRLRREPRSEGLATIEAAAMVLASLERRPEIADTLHAGFERMLARYREVQAEMPELAPKPAPRGGRRQGRRRRQS